MIKSDVKNDGRQLAIQGAVSLARTVTQTMGPHGRRVAIGSPGQIGFLSKDGHTVARYYYHEDPHQEVGCQILKSGMSSVAGSAGDATTQTAHLVAQMLSSLPEKYNTRQIKSELMDAARTAVEKAFELSGPVEQGDFDALLRVATTSCNNDAELGAVMANMFMSVGVNGFVKIIKTDKFNGIRPTVIPGYKISTGYITQHFVKSNKDAMNNPLVYVTEDAIMDSATIAPCLDRYTNYVKSLREGEEIRPLLIVCSKATEMGAKQIAAAKSVTLKKGKLEAKVDIDVRAIYSTQYDELKDISVITGAKFFADFDATSAKMSKEYKGDDYFGSCPQVVIEPSGTTFIFQKTRAVADHIDSIVEDKVRKAKLLSGVGLIEVGAQTGAEIEDTCHLLEDAEGACRGALQYGVLPGGGWAHQQISAFIPETAGGNLLAGAMRSVFEHLANLSEAEHAEISATETFNFVTMQREGINSTTVLDATKSITEAITASVGIVCQLLGIGSSIINHEG